MINMGIGGWMSIVNSPSKPFKLRINTKEVKLLPFKEAANYTATSISLTYPKVHIAMSGGIDSEFVANVFYSGQYRFTPVIVLLDENTEESKHAIKWCEDRKIVPLIFDHRNRSEQFIKELIRISYENKFPGVTGSLVNYIAENIDGSVVTGDGDLNLDPFTLQGLSLFESDYYIAYQFKGSHPGGFFTYTPELFLACANELEFVSEDVFSDSDQLIPVGGWKHASQTAKCKLYGIDFRPKQSTKFDTVKFGEILQRSYKPAQKSIHNFGWKDDIIALLSA